MGDLQRPQGTLQPMAVRHNVDHAVYEVGHKNGVFNTSALEDLLGVEGREGVECCVLFTIELSKEGRK